VASKRENHAVSAVKPSPIPHRRSSLVILGALVYLVAMIGAMAILDIRLPERVGASRADFTD